MEKFIKLQKTVILLLMAQICFGQSGIEYEFDANYSYHKMKDLEFDPLVYSVDEITYEEEVKVGEIAIINEDYFYLQRKIEKLAKDSIYYHDKLNTLNKRHDDYFKIKDLIHDFVSSPESFNDKKEKLILAKGLADDNELEVLLYADEKNNSDDRMRFAVLQIDDKGLNDHLIRVSKNIENLFTTLPFSKLRFTNVLLNRYRRAIKGLNKNNYIDGGYKTQETPGLTINRSLNGIKSFQGKFKKIGEYYIINKDYEDLFVEGDIVNRATANKYRLSEKGFTTGTKILMRKEEGNDLYLADYGFISQYAYVIDGRTNGEINHKTEVVGGK